MSSDEEAAQALLVPFLGLGLEERRARVATLAPRADDCARVFRSDAVPRARDVYDALWATRPAFGPRPGQTELAVHVAAAEDFHGRSARARPFPGGYVRVAPLLRAGVVWVCWRFVAAGERLGLAFDGLVRLDERWVWFPKPWRALLGRSALPVRHWLE
jgi:hypothetical protein